MLLIAVAAAAATACGGTGDVPAPPPPGDRAPPAADPGADLPMEPEPPPAPWSGAVLSPAEVPDVYLEQWSQAENREWCPLLAPRDPAPPAEPRAAQFGGGWGVAYDLPEIRSAYGIAGTGVRPGPDTYDQWPHQRRWADGSRAGYGPEGGTGANQLAYLRVSGVGCLYNVWSRLGVRHLEQLLEQLRFVRDHGRP